MPSPDRQTKKYIYQTQDVNLSYIFIFKSICLPPFFLHFFQFYEKKDFPSYQLKVKNNETEENIQKKLR